MFCQKCGAEIPQDSKVCPNCRALQGNAKFCQHCGEAIDKGCVVCPKCGKRVAEIQGKTQQPQIIVNNTNTATAIASVNGPRRKNKWVAFFLCLFFGYFGAHKFYEGKFAIGVIYIITLGMACIGWIVDIFKLLAKPNPYYV